MVAPFFRRDVKSYLFPLVHDSNYSSAYTASTETLSPSSKLVLVENREDENHECNLRCSLQELWNIEVEITERQHEQRHSLSCVWWQ